MFHVPEKYRVSNGFMGSDSSYGNNGMFAIPYYINEIKQILIVIASDGLGWEHVSVSRKDRCPVWEEMCIIKNIFWDDSDCVVQYHPPKSEYVNNHQYCLHMWRPINVSLPIPPNFLIGIK